jgi:glycosyltransferase involved in cell wall biosynthesis
VSVIVCTRNRPRELDACLAALARQSIAGFEVLVVDNGSVPPVADICERWGGRYLSQPKTGLCIARNAGAHRATGEIIVYLDDDASPAPDWLETLLEGFSDPSIACVTGRIRYMKALGDSRAMSAEEAPGAHTGRPPRIYDRKDRDWYVLACLGGVGDGSNMAFRRREFLASPGFDERLGRGRLIDGGDEHVLFMSLLALGHRIAHVPAAVVRHPYPATPELVRATRIRERRTAFAYLLFLWTEFPRRRADLVRHLARAMVRRARPSARGSPSAVGLNSLQAFAAAAGGVALYWSARAEWASLPMPSYHRLALS